MTSSDGLWLIEFSSNRIDIQKLNKNFEVTKIGEVEQFINETKEIIKVIDTKFPKKPEM